MLKININSTDKMTTMRLLRQIYMKMSVGQTSGTLRDVDGSEVGDWLYDAGEWGLAHTEPDGTEPS